MAARTCFPLLHLLLLAGSAVSQQPEAEQAGPYFLGFHHYLLAALDTLPAQFTEVKQAQYVADALASQYGSRLLFAVAIYSFPAQGSGSSILPDEPGSSVHAHTNNGAAASPDCSTINRDPQEACVESGGSLMRSFESTEILDGKQEEVKKYAMVFWWPNTEQRWPQEYVQRWSSAINFSGFLWKNNACRMYRGDNGFAGNIHASLVARCLYDSWVLGARGKTFNSCRGLLFAPQKRTSVSDVKGHLIQTSSQFGLRHRGGSMLDIVKYKIVMLP